jgi:hypothetical protein
LTAATKSKRIPPGLAKVRKELPPPARIFKSKKDERDESRKRSKEKLNQEFKKLLPD